MTKKNQPVQDPSRYFSLQDWRDGSAVGIKRIATTPCYQLRRPPRHDTL